MAVRWYAARTQPRAESASAAQLDRDGLEVFGPRINNPNPRAGHPDAPLFPGYLFVRLDVEDTGWPNVTPAHHLLGWVNFDGEPAWLPDEIVNDLKDRVAAINNRGGLWQEFHKGQTVRVVGNNLDSLAEVLEGAKSAHGTARVLLQFMGRLIQATVPCESLRPVGEAPQQKPTSPRRTRGGGRWVKGFRPAAALT